MRTTFFQSYHMPFLVIVGSAAWMMITSRIVTFQRPSGYDGWRTLRGLSVAFTIAAGCMLSTYICLNVGIYCADQYLFTIFDRQMNIADEQEIQTSASELSDDECEQAIKLVTSTIQMAVACRYMLTISLWLVKASLTAIYFQCLPIIRQRTAAVRITFQLTPPILITTLFVSLWLTCQSIVQVTAYPTIDDIRSGSYVNGVTFQELDDPTELTITLFNFSTDLLIIFLAYQTMQALSWRNVSDGWLMLIIGLSTIGAAMVRIIFVLISISCVDECYSGSTIERLFTPIVVMGECEAFTAVIVSCLPGLRAILRYRGPESDDRVEDELADCMQEDKSPALGLGLQPQMHNISNQNLQLNKETA